MAGILKLSNGIAVAVPDGVTYEYHALTVDAPAADASGATATQQATRYAGELARIMFPHLDVPGTDPATYSTTRDGEPVAQTFEAGRHYDLKLGAQRKDVFQRDTRTGGIMVHYEIPADAKVGDSIAIKLAGVQQGGEVTGGAVASAGAYDDYANRLGGAMEGQLSAFSVARTVDGTTIKPGGFVNVSLRIDGGAESFMLESALHRA